MATQQIHKKARLILTDAQVMCLRRVRDGEELYFTSINSKCPHCYHVLARESSAWWAASGRVQRSGMVETLIRADMLDIDEHGECFVTPLGDHWSHKMTLKDRKELGLLGGGRGKKARDVFHEQT